LQWLPNQSRKTLNAIEGVEASVSLEDATATITMEKHVPTATMQEALNLAGNYAIEMSKPTSDLIKV
jgi:Cu2+-exporting ATPase